jgi:hypothetical protein
MALSDLVLLLFILTAFLSRPKGQWKRTVLYVMGGVFLGDVIGAILIAVFYHSYPAILGWVRYFMATGAVAGGVWDWLTFTTSNPPEVTTRPEHLK